MAITIQQRPVFVSPVYNDLIYQISSDNYAATDFRFVCEVKDVSNNVLAKLKAPILNGTTDRGIFNVRRILESYLTYDFDLENDCEYFNTDNSIFKAVCNFGEDTAASGEVLGMTNASGWVWNASMTRRDFASYASGDWIVVDDDNNQFLTTQRSQRMRPNQWGWLYFLSLESPFGAYTKSAIYKSYDSGGNLLKTVELAYVGGSGGNYFISKVPIGHNISETTSTVLTGSLPVIDPSASYYTVQMMSESDTIISEVYRIDLVDDCTQYESINLYFLNSMGGFDSFMFDKISTTSIDISRKQMKRQLYGLNSGNYEYNLTKHGVATYDTTYQDKIKVNSDWLTDTESEFLKELLSSPVVFMHKSGEDFYTPVNITQTNWEVKTGLVHELFNCTLDLTFGDSERRQRG